MKKEFPNPNKLMYQKDFPGKEPAQNDKKEYSEEDQDYLLASSYTDCTGLIPAAPKTEHEIDSYEQIQHFLPPSYPSNSKENDDDKAMKIWN